MSATVAFDHANSAISPELFEWRTRLQNDAELSWSDAHGGFWIASRHADIVAILKDTTNFICAERITLPQQRSPVPVIPLESDEPDHSFYRAILLPFLTPNAVSHHDAPVRAIVTDALDALIARGEGNAVADFAAKIPARAMAMVFGFSDDDAYRFDSGFTEIIDAAGSGSLERQMAAVGSFKAFLTEKVEYRRAHPGNADLVSAMLRHESNGRRYTEDELLGLMWSAAGGAIDTTKHSIGHMVRALGVNPGIRGALIDDPKKIPVAVEESLRLNAASFMTARTLASTVNFGGVEMKKGQRVLLVHGFGSRDPAVFPEPDAMRLDRGVNRHLAFGHGIHMCAGMYLARMELKIAVEELLRRAPDYELVTPDAGPLLRGGMMWGYDVLPIRLPRRTS